VHPVFARQGRLDLYLGAWLPVAALLAAALALPGRRTWSEAAALALPMAVTAAFFSLAMWPLCKAMPLGRSRATSLLAAHAVAALATCSAWLLLGFGWAHLLETFPRFAGAVARYRADVPALLVVGSLLFLLAALINYLLLAFQSAREAERSALEHQILAREAELRALRAQLNPHFLFNSLNAIGSLAGSDAGRARQMTVLLSEFLRRTMTQGSRSQITLGEEMELVDRYLAVEQVRFGERLRVERVIEPATRDCAVPPLVLQPLVENAVTHGISRTLDGGTLNIAAVTRGDRLEIVIENPFDPDGGRRPGQGMGLENVRARLAVLHPGNSRVESTEAYDRFRVTVNLPAVRSGAAAATATAGAPASEVAPATSSTASEGRS
jgi:hypothetical protein